MLGAVCNGLKDQELNEQLIVNAGLRLDFCGSLFPEQRQEAGLRSQVIISETYLTRSPWVACVASVSNRVIARKLERKQKKG